MFAATVRRNRKLSGTRGRRCGARCPRPSRGHRRRRPGPGPRVGSRSAASAHQRALAGTRRSRRWPRIAGLDREFDAESTSRPSWAKLTSSKRTAPASTSGAAAPAWAAIRPRRARPAPRTRGARRSRFAPACSRWSPSPVICVANCCRRPANTTSCPSVSASRRHQRAAVAEQDRDVQHGDERDPSGEAADALEDLLLLVAHRAVAAAEALQLLRLGAERLGDRGSPSPLRTSPAPSRPKARGSSRRQDAPSARSGGSPARSAASAPGRRPPGTA